MPITDVDQVHGAIVMNNCVSVSYGEIAEIRKIGGCHDFRNDGCRQVRRLGWHGHTSDVCRSLRQESMGYRSMPQTTKPMALMTTHHDQVNPFVICQLKQVNRCVAKTLSHLDIDVLR